MERPSNLAEYNDFIKNIIEMAINDIIPKKPEYDMVIKFIRKTFVLPDTFELGALRIMVRTFTEFKEKLPEYELEFPTLTEEKNVTVLKSFQNAVLIYLFDNDILTDEEKRLASTQTIDVIKKVSQINPQDDLLNKAEHKIDILKGISEIKTSEEVGDPILTNQRNKIKVNLSVPELAYLFKLLSESKPDIFDVKTKSELYRFISENFITKGKTETAISTNSLNKFFSEADKDVANFWIEHLKKMLVEARKV